ncbi:DNA polymerase III subunit alpha [Virgibacillus sp. W0181]|uniref:DNA polymerase III subunit alpha n=1 Tax=Virgibacillus sp. W0181 TaxID=3391581 RepID=UPI003F4595AD
MSFTHLQVRSGYSLFNSTISVHKLVRKASELGFRSLALTDEQVMYGAISFYKSCQENGIKPIIGMTVLIELEEETVSCILLAKNNAGYKQLMQISSCIQKKEYKQMHYNEMQQYMENIKCIIPVTNNKLHTLLDAQLYDQAFTYINHYWKKTLTNGDFYLGVYDHGSTDERDLNEKSQSFQSVYNVPFVALNDVRYLEKRDNVAYDCIRAIQRNEQWSINNVDNSFNNRFLRSEKEMVQTFDYWPEAIQTIEELVEECDVKLQFDQQLLPTFPVEKDLSSDSYLEELCWKNAKEKFDPITDEVTDRLAHELITIQQMGFSDYFLIVADFVSYAKKNGILTGPGRGSAAGSLVAYVLGITEVDPLRYGLLFERFLNPERISMPDIDIDFSDYRRDEVIQYVRKKYGAEHVAQIITFGTYAARSVIRELIKTMNINDQDAAFILSHIPVQANRSLKEYIEGSEELKTYIKQSNELKTLFMIAITLEGLPRHISTHAAGVVITEKRLTNYIPILTGSNETNVTQYSMTDLEAIGLLKIDLLGLRNLTMIEQIVRSIKQRTETKIDLEAIPIQDDKTFMLLQEGSTNGIFQFESQGMKEVLTRLSPDSFEDLVAVNALYRPGPMEFITTYIQRKNKSEALTYLHPDLEPILKQTYGVLIYQEQIMLIANKFAGFSYGQADILRRAVSKKQKNVMEQQQRAFIDGCITNGYSLEVAEQIFSWILKFSDYGFNRSHAVSYSKIAYQLAYLKAHYPIHFFRELLSTVVNQQEKIHLYIKEMKKLNIRVAAPSINYSFGKFSVENDTVRIGLSLIKGIGNQVIKEIVRARKQGLFKNLFDFCARVSPSIVNRTTIELLVRAGAFDETYANRASLLASIDQAMERGELFGDFNDQRSLFENGLEFEPAYIEIDDFNQTRKLQDEKELLGIYVSSHPLAVYRKQLETMGYTTLQQAKTMKNNRRLKTVVIVQAIKSIRTKRGDRMAFLTLGDETDEMEAVLFPEVYRSAMHIVEEGNETEVVGKINERNGRIQWVIDSINPFQPSVLSSHVEKRLFIKVTGQDSEHILQLIKMAAREHPGDTPIIVHQPEYNKTYQLEGRFQIDANDSALKLLKENIGNENVVLKTSEK